MEKLRRVLTSKGFVATYIAVILCGLLLLVAGVGVGVALYISLRISHTNNIIISSHSSTGYNTWTDELRSQNGSHWVVQVFFWNVSNPAEVISGAARPALDLVGPLEYGLRELAVDPKFSDAGDTVEYYRRSLYSAVSASSAALASQHLTLADPLFSSAATLFASRTAAGWAWGTGSWRGLLRANDTTADLARNGSSPLLLRRHTGHSSLRLVSSLISRDGNKSLDIWGGSQSVSVSDARDSPQFAPFQVSASGLTPSAWCEELLRPIVFEYSRSEDVSAADAGGGSPVHVSRFTAKEVWQGETKQFYDVKGFVNASALFGGRPVFVSAPMFDSKNASDWKSNATFSGADESEDHAICMHLDTQTGTAIGAQLDLQYNVYVDANRSALTGVPVGMYPFAWVRKTLVPSVSQVHESRHVSSVRHTADAVLIGCVVPGTFLMVVGLTMLSFWLGKNRSSDTVHALQPQQQPAIPMNTIKIRPVE